MMNKNTLLAIDLVKELKNNKLIIVLVLSTTVILNPLSLSLLINSLIEECSRSNKEV